MALLWSWAFGNEDATKLLTIGFGNNGTARVVPTNSSNSLYTYSGDNSGRYSLALDGHYGYIELPLSVTSSFNSGWVSIPVKSISTLGYYGNQILIRALAGSGSNRGVYAQANSTGTISLYVDNVFKETTTALDLTGFRYIALKFDMSGSTWSGQVYVDGAAATSQHTSTRTAESSTLVRIGPGWGWLGNPDFILGQVVLYDDVADSGETPMYVTRISPDADSPFTSAGWTPSTGSDDYAVVVPPLDSTTYTRKSTPTSGDVIGLFTDGGVGTTINSKLNTTADTIVGRATTDTLTNKTISGSSNTLSNIGNSSLSNSAVTVGTTSISLGASSTTIAGVSDLTAGSINIAGNVIKSNGSSVVEIGAGDGLSVAGNLTVAGNMTVTGSTTTVSSTNTTLADQFIELGTGRSGSA